MVLSLFGVFFAEMSGLRRLGTIFDPLRAFEREVDKVMEKGVPPTLLELSAKRRLQRKNALKKKMEREAELAVPPHLDIVEMDDHVTIVAEMPGVTKEKVTVEIVDGNTLSIQGQRIESEFASADKLLMSEREHGIFQRSIRLPNYLDTDNIAATYKDGLLCVRVPKQRPKHAVRQIDL